MLNDISLMSLGDIINFFISISCHEVECAILSTVISTGLQLSSTEVLGMAWMSDPKGLSTGATDSGSVGIGGIRLWKAVTAVGSRENNLIINGLLHMLLNRLLHLL